MRLWARATPLRSERSRKHQREARHSKEARRDAIPLLAHHAMIETTDWLCTSKSGTAADTIYDTWICGQVRASAEQHHGGKGNRQTIRTISSRARVPIQRHIRTIRYTPAKLAVNAMEAATSRIPKEATINPTESTTKLTPHNFAPSSTVLPLPRCNHPFPFGR